MNKIHYIYKIHFLCGFPTGRYYIGKHTGYINDSYTGSGTFCKHYFKKYGKEPGVTYIKEILEINPSKKINGKREVIIIGDLWRTDPLCMNCIGGNPNLAEIRIPTREKISRKMKGNKNGLGKKKSEKEKQYLREKFGKKVLQYDLDGNLLNEYISLHDAAKAVNGFPICISDCCNKQNRSTCYGYIWRFIENPLKEGEAELITRHYTRIIAQLDKNGNFIKYFKSIVEAAKEVGVKPCTISIALTRGSLVKGKYRWKYMEDIENAKA